MRSSGWMRRVFALLLSGLAAAEPALAQSLERGPPSAQAADPGAVEARLADATADTKVQMNLRFTSGPSLQDLHELLLRLHPPLVTFFAEARSLPASERLGVSESSGEWPGQAADRWPQTVCNVRMAFVLQSKTDVPASQIFVNELTATAPAPIAREMLHALARTVRHAELTRLSDEQYDLQHRGSVRLRKAGIRWVAEDFNIPSGCDAYARRARGMRLQGGTTPRVLVANIAEDAPDQPVELVLRFASGSPIRDIAGLVTSYRISRLSLSASVQTSPNSYSGLFFVDFGSTGASHEQQLDRAECQLRAVMRGSDPSIVLIDRKFQLILQANADMKAKDAARLMNVAPGWIGIGFGRFLEADALEASEKAFVASFKEPITARDASAVPASCARYLAKK